MNKLEHLLGQKSKTKCKIFLIFYFESKREMEKYYRFYLLAFQ